MLNFNVGAHIYLNSIVGNILYRLHLSSSILSCCWQHHARMRACAHMNMLLEKSKRRGKFFQYVISFEITVAYRFKWKELSRSTLMIITCMERKNSAPLDMSDSSDIFASFEAHTTESSTIHNHKPSQKSGFIRFDPYSKFDTKEHTISAIKTIRALRITLQYKEPWFYIFCNKKDWCWILTTAISFTLTIWLRHLQCLYLKTGVIQQKMMTM